MQATFDAEYAAESIQQAGVAGAGGAGFPSYVKWQDLETVDALLINHQESEPNFYADKWLAQEYTAELSQLFDALLDGVFDVILIGTKEQYREEWTKPLEDSFNATVIEPDDLPATVDDHSGIYIAYTPNVYTYSEESVLLTVTANVHIGDDLPTDHGWIVHNTESILNIARALTKETPVTQKYVHVDGPRIQHRCLSVPIGTPGDVLLEAAGLEEDVPSELLLADGGPGWCYEIEQAPDEFGVRKRTNAILLLDRDVATTNRDDDGRINVLEAVDWSPPHETSPTPLEPDRVRIPLLTNHAYDGFVERSTPVVSPGDRVETEDVVAEPADDPVSNTQHASIDGIVRDVTANAVEIHRH